MLWNTFPFKTTRFSNLRLFLSLLILRHIVLAQTHSIQAPARKMDGKKPPKPRPPVYCREKSNRRGRPDPFTFVCLNSFNSSWREEEGGCKMNERSEQEEFIWSQETSQWAAETARTHNRRLTFISTFHDNKRTKNVSKEEGKGAGRK